MFPRRYVRLEVSIDDYATFREAVPADESFDIAAERYRHYSHQLGAFAGSSIVNGHTVDRFERGRISIQH
jgi:hypothetical protein